MYGIDSDNSNNIYVAIYIYSIEVSSLHFMPTEM